MSQKLPFKLKALVQNNAVLYDALYQLVTLNRDMLRMKLGRERYPSRFGGLWTDSDQFEQKLTDKLKANEIRTEDELPLRQFRETGYLVLEQAVPGDLIDRYLSELDELRQRDNTPLLVTSADLEDPIPYTEDVHTRFRSIRTVDDYYFLSSARDILFSPAIRDSLALLLEQEPKLTQSLNFLHGSQQGMHQDTSFVRMNSPMKLLGVWIALEDVTPGSGELIYFPGSHHWDDYLFSGRFKHHDRDRDGEEALDDNYLWLYQQARERGVEEARFLPRKGDVLVWHATLAHGGAKVTREDITRRSLVGHFCPHSVKPLYSLYKPGQQKVHRDGDRQYMSSYYRG